MNWHVFCGQTAEHLWQQQLCSEVGHADVSGRWQRRLWAANGSTANVQGDVLQKPKSQTWCVFSPAASLLKRGFLTQGFNLRFHFSSLLRLPATHNASLSAEASVSPSNIISRWWYLLWMQLHIHQKCLLHAAGWETSLSPDVEDVKAAEINWK